MRQLFCTGSLQTPMLMLHENFPGLRSWDVLSLCYKCISLAKIAKFGRSCLGRLCFLFLPNTGKEPTTLSNTKCTQIMRLCIV